MATEVTIGDRTYIAGKLGAKDQFHVFRRVMPLLTPILGMLQAEMRGESVNRLIMTMIMSEDLAKMPDDTLDYVIHKCLEVVEVQTEGKPLKLIVNGRSMFGDMDLPTMIGIVWAVLMENFRPFLSGLLAGPSNGEAATLGT